MRWDEFLIQKLAELGLEIELVSLLEHISKNILLGGAYLRSKLKSVWRQRRAEVHIYTASDLVDLWRHVYGQTWTWDVWRGDRIIREGLALELRGVTLHEYLSTQPGFRYTLRSDEYKQKAREYFPQSYQNLAEELDCLYWGQEHQDIGILDVRYGSLLVGNERRHLLGATAGKAEGSPSSFPVMVREEVYQQLAEGLRLYGAVRIEKITGNISIGDERLKVPLRRALHRDPLFLDADEDQRMVVLDRPHQILGDAWTVAEIDGGRCILGFTFALGSMDWETQLAEKCWIVEEFCKKHGGYPVFDFDGRQGRFKSAKINPEIVGDWYDQVVGWLMGDV
jgi:hypothetical protein